ncbi:hypothetical protein BCR37DRAFT_378006 [Protomyces lactucae-debilis]|uniref:Uncharacterized protein n=1 Tax=Protomyces lactucae-debilis TaxID=2754530 RepID=A0A1Y2FN68_PROLT|nr:uncharacterized protein BCR37DRAFT_378006 [Protomyces lactucae-debilis]ORY85027.1 hypothetical protein BCR37DRAFT_378006 [Protomyces lactucae-debilis]
MHASSRSPSIMFKVLVLLTNITILLHFFQLATTIAEPVRDGNKGKSVDYNTGTGQTAWRVPLTAAQGKALLDQFSRDEIFVAKTGEEFCYDSKFTFVGMMEPLWVAMNPQKSSADDEVMLQKLCADWCAKELKEYAQALSGHFARWDDKPGQGLPKCIKNRWFKLCSKWTITHPASLYCPELASGRCLFPGSPCACQFDLKLDSVLWSKVRFGDAVFYHVSPRVSHQRLESSRLLEFLTAGKGECSIDRLIPEFLGPHIFRPNNQVVWVQVASEIVQERRPCETDRNPCACSKRSKKSQMVNGHRPLPDPQLCHIHNMDFLTWHCQAQTFTAGHCQSQLQEPALPSSREGGLNHGQLLMPHSGQGHSQQIVNTTDDFLVDECLELYRNMDQFGTTVNHCVATDSTMGQCSTSGQQCQELEDTEYDLQMQMFLESFNTKENEPRTFM